MIKELRKLHIELDQRAAEAFTRYKDIVARRDAVSLVIAELQREPSLPPVQRSNAGGRPVTEDVADVLSQMPDVFTAKDVLNALPYDTDRSNVSQIVARFAARRQFGVRIASRGRGRRPTLYEIRRPESGESSVAEMAGSDPDTSAPEAPDTNTTDQEAAP